MEHGASNFTGNVEDLIKRGEELCERLTVCPSSSRASMTRSVQNSTPFPSQGGDRASPSEHAIAPDIQGIDPFRPATPFILSLASRWLESETTVTDAVSADITQNASDWLYGAGMQRFMVPCDAYSSYQTAVEPRPVVRDTDHYCETGSNVGKFPG